MAEPALIVVDDEQASRQMLAQELHQRYGASYQIVAAGTAEEALDRLAELRAAGTDVPLILADQWMPGMTGTQLLARARSWSRLSCARMWLRPGGLVATPGRTAQLEAGW